MNLMDIIGPDCQKIIYSYKKLFDFIFYQKKAIIDLINSKDNNCRLKQLDISYEDFKHIYLKYNQYNKSIKFTINCYDNYKDKRLFDLNFKIDKDHMLYDYKIIAMSKNTTNKSILIQLYNIKYDYNLLDKQSKNNPDRMNFDDLDSDLI